VEVKSESSLASSRFVERLAIMSSAGHELYSVSQKNDTDIAHYNFNAHQPNLVISDSDTARRLPY